MTVGQLVECNMRNIFFLKNQTKCDGKLVPDDVVNFLIYVEMYVLTIILVYTY